MRKGLVFILTMLFVLGSVTTVYAADEDAAAENTITLEQARALVKANSRSMKKYEINVDKTKYQLKQAEDQQDDVYDSYNSLSAKYDELEQELQNQLNLGDNSDEDKIKEIQAQMREVEGEMKSQYDKVESSSDSIKDAENTYDDSVKEEENYRKQLGFIVDELYITILNQEDSLVALHKEYELKQCLFDIEKTKLQLGRSSQLKVSQLNADIVSLNKSIMELTDNIKIKKGQLNDMMGRGYDVKLKLTPFTVPATAELPGYEQLLSGAMRTYNTLSQLKRVINEREDDLDDEDDYYKYLLLRLDIKEKELQLEDEKNHVKEAIDNLLSDVKSKQEGYQLAQINLKNAQSAYDWDKKRYEMGLVSKLALMESEWNYLNTKDKEASSGYALYLAQGSLKLAEDGILIN